MTVVRLYRTTLDPSFRRVTADIDAYLSHFDPVLKEIPDFVPDNRGFSISFTGGSEIQTYNYMTFFYLGKRYFCFLDAQTSTPNACTFWAMIDWWSMGQHTDTSTNVSGYLLRTNETSSYNDTSFHLLNAPVPGTTWLRDVGTIRSTLRTVRLVISLRYYAEADPTEKFWFMGMSSASYDITDGAGFREWIADTLYQLSLSDSFQKPYDRVTTFKIEGFDFLYVIPDALLVEDQPFGETDKSGLVKGENAVTTSWDQLKTTVTTVKATFKVNSNDLVICGNRLVQEPIPFNGSRDTVVTYTCTVDNRAKAVSVAMNANGNERDLTTSLTCSFASYEQSTEQAIAKMRSDSGLVMSTITQTINGVKGGVAGYMIGGVPGAIIGAAPAVLSIAQNTSLADIRFPKYSAVTFDTGAIMIASQMPETYTDGLHSIGCFGVFTVTRRNAHEVDNTNLNDGMGCYIPLYGASIYRPPNTPTKHFWAYAVGSPMVTGDLPNYGKEVLEGVLERGVMVYNDTADYLAYGMPNTYDAATLDLTDDGETVIIHG